MDTFWIVAADSARAEIFRVARKGGPLETLDTLVHGASRLKGRDLRSDRQGRSFDSGGQGRHAMSSEVNPRQHESEQFAREIANKIETGRNAGSYDKLILIAAPGFLGTLRKALSQPATEMVAEYLDKSLVGVGADEIRKRLETRL